MNDLQVFQNPEFGNVRVIDIDGNPWFVGVDVCNCLGYEIPRHAITRHVDSEDVLKRDILSNGGIQQTTIINESGLYSLILGSKLDSAKRFKRWVTSEVLPSIRKHGMYAVDELINNPDLLIEIASELKKSREKIQSLEDESKLKDQQIAELTPKASYYDVVLNCKDLVATSVIAKDFGKSAKWLNKFLEKQGVQFFLKGQKVWLLKAKFQGFGYTKTKTQSFNGSDGEIHTSVHNYWTQKGRLFIYNLLKSLGFSPLIEL